MTDLKKEVAARQTAALSGVQAAQTNSRKSHSRVLVLIGALCLGIAGGLAMGWLSHDFQANQANKAADAAVKGTGDDFTGPCKVWAETICQGMGDLAYECSHARAASVLLSGSACVLARESVLSKIDALKAERAPCNELTHKLCGDLGTDAKGCELAIAKEATFSVKECQDMTNGYPRVLAQILERQKNGTLPKPPRDPQHLTIARPN